MGKAAARKDDYHVCSKPQHVGGPITAGSGDVNINGKPAARVGDPAKCKTATDSIKKGSATVVIDGKPAARAGDKTEHSGTIVAGSGNVFFGDGGNPVHIGGNGQVNIGSNGTVNIG